MRGDSGDGGVIFVGFGDPCRPDGYSLISFVLLNLDSCVSTLTTLSAFLSNIRIKAAIFVTLGLDMWPSYLGNASRTRTFLWRRDFGEYVR